MPFCDPLRQSTKRHIASDFIGDFADLSNDRWFLGIGRTSEWSVRGTDVIPPQSIDSVQDNTDFWRNLIAAKRISKDDISLVVPRYDWIGGTVYTPYRDDIDLFNDLDPAKFYVLVDDERVYKCIDNAYGARSTIPPTHTDAQIRQLADGYRWKFLYQITESKRKFLTKTYITEGTSVGTTTRQGYMPVEYVDLLKLNDERVLQYSIQQSAVDGEIAFTLLNQQYIGSLVSDNRCLFQANLNTISYADGVTTLYVYSPSLISVADHYESMILSIETGPLAGERRVITSYSFVDGQGVFVIDGSYAGYDGDGESYELNTTARILPNIEIVGDGRAGSDPANPTLGYADVLVKFGGTAPGITSGCAVNIQQNYVSSFEMVDPGKDYTYASFNVIAGLTFVGSSGYDINDIGRPIMSPVGGHGSNPVLELGAASLMIVKDFDQDEESQVPVDNDYRQIGIIKNPELYKSRYRLILAQSGVSGSFPTGYTATQGYTGFNGGTGFDLAQGKIVEWLTGWPSADTSNYASAEVVVEGQVDPTTGDMTGGNFSSYGIVTSPINTTFGVVYVEPVTYAGTEGRFLKRLEIVSNDSAILSGTEFYRGQYAQGVGNADINISPSRAIGRIYSYQLQPGTNTRAYLLVEGNDNFKTDERVIPCDFYIRPLGSLTAGPRITGIDEVYIGGFETYKATTKISLSAGSGSGRFDEDSFVKDDLFVSGESSAVIVSWSPGVSGFTGNMVLSAVNGSFDIGATSNYLYNEQSYVSTIMGIHSHPDLKYHSGEVSYIQNMRPVQRSNEQREQIKVLIKF